MVENRPGHEDTQHGEDRRLPPAPDGAPDAHADPLTEVDVDAAIEPPSHSAPELTMEQLRASAAEEQEDERRLQAAIDAAPLPEPAADQPETRFAAASPEAAEEPAARPSAAEPRRPGIAAAMLPPVLAVAIAAAVVVGAAKTGLLPDYFMTAASAPQGDAAALDALKARIAELEARPAPTALNPAAPPAAAADPALVGRVEALEKTVASLGGELAALRTRAESAPAAAAAAASTDGTATDRPAADKPAGDSSSVDAAAALAAINARLTELEQAAKAAPEAKPAPEAAPQAAPPPATADDLPLRRLVTATMLDLTVTQGAPYAAILKAAQPLAADPAALRPLAPFAETGVPSAAALGRELLALLPKLLPGSDPANTTSFIDRFQANAERLVRIQRSDVAAGVDRIAVVGRLTAAAQRGDLAEARRELKALAPADRAPVQSWIDRSEARDQAVAASQSFATAALAALSKPSP